MKKILILANNDVGLYKFRKELIQELRNHDNEVYISLPYGELVKPLIDMGCEFINTNVDRRGLNPIRDLKLLTVYFNTINTVKPDMVITYTVKPNVYGGIICRFLKVSYAINITGLGTAFQNNGLLTKLIVFLYKLSSKNAKVVFFENEENQRIFINNKIIDKEKTCKLNGAGVNLEEYQLYEYPPDNVIHFLFIGRVMKEKGVDELFEVAKRIKKEHQNIVFDIVGPLEDDYQYIINNLVKQDIINYHGFHTDVRPFIRQAHCFILPSHHEGMANTLLECGAMGRPLITSNIHGCKEAVINGENGYLVKVKDSQDLYVKIKKFIRLSYSDKVLMSKSSNEHISKNFNRKMILNDTIQELNL